MLKLSPRLPRTLSLLTLSLLAAFTSEAHADGHHGGRGHSDNNRRGIVIGPNETVDCAKYDNYTQITCNPYRQRREHDDPYSPAHVLLQRLTPFQTGECLKDRAGGIVFQCHIPAGWVDPNPQPLPEPEPEVRRPMDARELYLRQTHEEVNRLLGNLSSTLSGEKGPRIQPDAIRQINSYVDYFRGVLSPFGFIAPPSCNAQNCSPLQKAAETAYAVANAFAAIDALSFNETQLAQLKGYAQAAYDLTKQADAAPAMTANDVCGKMLFGEGAGGNLFRVTNFTMRNTITESSPNAAYVRVEFLTSSAKPIEASDDGDCRKVKPNVWHLKVPFKGQELVVEFRQVSPESKSVTVTATHGGQAIKIRQ